MREEILPDSWQWTRVSDVCETIDYGYTASADFSVQEPRFLRITDIQNGHVEWETVPGCVISETEEVNNRLKDGDIVFARTGGTTGKSYLITNPPRAVFASYLIRLRAKQDIVLPNYLYAFFQSDDYWRQVRANARGGAQPNVNASLLGAITLPLPPLHEQQRITTILEEQMAAIQEARAAAQAQLDAAENLSAAYLREVFESDEAQGWESVQLGEILIRNTEIIHPHDNPSGHAIFVGLEHIESGTGDRIGCLDVEMSELTGRKPKFYEGQIVYGYLRPYLNKVWIAEFDGLCSVDQYIYSVNSNAADTEFVAWFMRSPIYLERSPVGSNTSQLPRIRAEEVASIAINLPSLDEQKRVTALINATISETLRVQQLLRDQMTYLDELPAALLRQAFSGEL